MKCFPEDTIEMGRLAVQTGQWIQGEYKDGNFRITYKPAKRKPVAEYLSRQERFSLLTPEDIEELQAEVDKNWERYNSL